MEIIESLMPWAKVLISVMMLGLLSVLALQAVVLFIVPRYTAWRAQRVGKVPDDEANRVRARLITFVQEASTQRGMPVGLKDFWKGTGYTSAQRFCILKPLLDTGTLEAEQISDGLLNVLQALWHTTLSQPRQTVVLCERDWTRMAMPTPVQMNFLVGAIQTGGVGNRASVSQNLQVNVANTEPTGDADWLCSELRSIGIHDDDVYALNAALGDCSEPDKRSTTKTWLTALLGRVADVAGQTTAGVLANLVTPLLLRYLGATAL